MKRFFLLLSGALGSILLHAEERTADTLFYELQSIEVVAVRASESSSAATSTIDAEQIRRENYGQDVPTLLQGLASVVVTSESGDGIGATSLRIRGTDATRINVTMNGMPLNDPDSHAMYWYDTPDLLGGTGKVQVIRGAGTTTNGTGAFGGALAMATAPLSSEFGGDLSVSYGAFKTSRQAFHISSGLLGGHWMTDLRLSHIASDGYIDRGFTKMGSYMLQTGWYGGSGTVVKFVSFGGRTKTYLTYNGVSREDLDSYGPTYHTSGQYVTSDSPFVLKDGTRVAYFDDQTDNYFQTSNQLILDCRISERWQMNAMLHYTFGDGYYRQYKDDAWLAGYNNLVTDWDQADLIRRKVMKSHRAGATATSVYSADRLRLVIGGSYLYYFSPHFGTIDWIDGKEASLYENFRWYDNQARKHDANLLAKADWTLCKGLTAHFELQYRFVKYRADGTNDNYDWTRGVMQPIDVDKSWHFLNPSVSLSWTFGKMYELVGSFAKTSKEPTRSDFTDRYMFSSISNEEPRPERLYDGELAWKMTGKIVQASAGLYYMYYRDQLVPTGIVNDSEDNLNVNVDKSFRRGIELTVGIKPLSWLDFGGNCTLSQNRIESVGDIAYSPSVLSNVWVRFNAGGFEALVRGQYVGKQYVSLANIDSQALDPYFIGNIDLGYTLKKLRFGVRVANFTNSRYFAYGYGDYVFPQAPINVSGSVTIEF